MNFHIVFSDSVLNLIYLISCLMFFCMSLNRLSISLPRLRRALILTLNSLMVMMVKRDRKYFCTQRIYDLWRTVPVTLVWLTSTLLTVVITLGYQDVPIEAKSIMSIFILLAFLIYRIFDIPASKKPDDDKFRNPRD